MGRFTKEAPSSRRGYPTKRREIGKRILVVCGSKGTEEIYLRKLKSSLRNSTTAIKIYKKDKDPLRVVAHAHLLKQQNGRDYDAYWAVFDVDEFNIYPALTKAAKYKINVAVSNPCFELWLILHFQDCHAHIGGYKPARDILARHLPNYAKTEFDFRKLEPGVEDACRRAVTLDSRAQRPYANPSAGIWQLVLDIIGKKKKEIQ